MKEFSKKKGMTLKGNLKNMKKKLQGMLMKLIIYVDNQNELKGKMKIYEDKLTCYWVKRIGLLANMKN
jgi:hypothetical protein